MVKYVSKLNSRESHDFEITMSIISMLKKYFWHIIIDIIAIAIAVILCRYSLGWQYLHQQGRAYTTGAYEGASFPLK